MPKSKLPQLSDVQIKVLKLGTIYRLSRSSMGWSAPDDVRVYSAATIKSLARLRLIDANFDDPRGFGPCEQMKGIQNLDGARFEHSPTVPILAVWTNTAGMEVLKSLGFTPGREEISNMLAQIEATERELRHSKAFGTLPRRSRSRPKAKKSADVVSLIERRREMAKKMRNGASK